MNNSGGQSLTYVWDFMTSLAYQALNLIHTAEINNYFVVQKNKSTYERCIVLERNQKKTLKGLV